MNLKPWKWFFLFCYSIFLGAESIYAYCCWVYVCVRVWPGLIVLHSSQIVTSLSHRPLNMCTFCVSHVSPIATFICFVCHAWSWFVDEVISSIIRWNFEFSLSAWFGWWATNILSIFGTSLNSQKSFKMTENGVPWNLSQVSLIFVHKSDKVKVSKSVSCTHLIWL